MKTHYIMIGEVYTPLDQEAFEELLYVLRAAHGRISHEIGKPIDMKESSELALRLAPIQSAYEALMLEVTNVFKS